MGYKILVVVFLGFLGCKSDCLYKENIEIINKYKNGQISEKYLTSIVICDTIKQGYYFRYSTEGVLLEKSNFKDNLYQGIKYKYYRTGSLEAVTLFNNGKVDSIQHRYYENGYTKSIYNFKQDIFSGQQLDFYENGDIKEYSLYAVLGEEKLLFIRRYDLNGNVSEQEGSPFTDIFFNADNYRKGDSIKIKAFYAKPPSMISEVSIIKMEDKFKANYTYKIINPGSYFIYRDIINADSSYRLDINLQLSDEKMTNIERYTITLQKIVK